MADEKQEPTSVDVFSDGKDTRGFVSLTVDIEMHVSSELSSSAISPSD